MTHNADAVRAIFDREVLQMEANMEPSPMVEWLERLRDEVLAALHNDGSLEPVTLPSTEDARRSGSPAPGTHS